MLTPQGILHLNPCAKVSACDAIPDPASPPGSSCCLATNFTPPTDVSCGKVGSHRFTTDIDAPELQIAMIQSLGTKCGYILQPDKAMEVTIAFVCDKSLPDPGGTRLPPRGYPARFAGLIPGVVGGAGKLTFDADQSCQGKPCYCNYNVTWRTASACALPPSARPGSLGADWGEDFLLYFFAFLILYFGVGTFIKSRLPNHSDACYNNIPQRDFWFGLPSLMGDGAAFAMSMGKQKANKAGLAGEEYESIDTARDTPAADGPKE